MSWSVSESPVGLTGAERRRRAILDATLRVIGRGGTDAVTLRRVAAEAQVPLGSTSYYFSGREELIREAFRSHLQWGESSMTRVRRRYPAHPELDQLVDFFIELKRPQLGDKTLLRAEYELILFASTDPALAAELLAFEDRLLGQLAQMLEGLGVAMPFEAARIALHLGRGVEIHTLNREGPDLELVRRQLGKIWSAVVEARQD
jgi:AcrR family transcriptional regulator